MTGVEVGDRVRIVSEGEITFLRGPYAEYRYDSGESGSVILHRDAEVTVLKRPVRKLSVGDKITGEELRKRQWKRGTMIEYYSRSHGAPYAYVLNANGEWYSVNVDRTYKFDWFTPTAEFTIKYLP